MTLRRGSGPRSITLIRATVGYGTWPPFDGLLGPYQLRCFSQGVGTRFGCSWLHVGPCSSGCHARMFSFSVGCRVIFAGFWLAGKTKLGILPFGYLKPV